MTLNLLTGTFANSEDPGSALFAKTKLQYFFQKFEFGTPQYYTMDHPDLSVSNSMENFIGLQTLNHACAAIQWVRGLNFGFILHLCPYFVFAKGEGWVKTARFV